MSDGICAILLAHAAARPDAPALVVPEDPRARRHRVVSYGALTDAVRRLAARLEAEGLRPGDRIVVFTPLSEALYVWLLAIWWTGGVAVFLDPWMGLSGLSDALARTSPAAVVLPRRWHALRFFWPPLGRVPRILDAATALAPGSPELACRAPKAAGEHDPALVTFTTGSSGRPKGAIRTHGTLLAQHRLLAAELGDGPGDVALATLPVFTLHHLATGAAVLLPVRHRLAGHDAAAATAREQMRAQGATLVVASPALLAAWVRQGVPVPGLRAVFVGGGAVDPALPPAAARIFPDARVAIGYGSTEAEPVALCRGEPSWEVLATGTLEGGGVCVGLPVPGVGLRLSEQDEVLVAGPHVVRAYWGEDGLPAGKSVDADGVLWHHMGDVGRLDEFGRLWLLGRVGDPILSFGTIRHALALEQWLGAQGLVGGAGLISVDGEVVLAVEGPLDPGLGAALSRVGLAALPVVRVSRIPRDPRHRTKVDRAALRRVVGRRRYTVWP
ncbi:MAG: AMP-binding protein [Candidatus Sericytochromatia bacterium]|nr:AMP-binding protein [Candidatus Sericytochromatia bacterium]